LLLATCYSLPAASQGFEWVVRAELNKQIGVMLVLDDQDLTDWHHAVEKAEIMFNGIPDFLTGPARGLVYWTTQVRYWLYNSMIYHDDACDLVDSYPIADAHKYRFRSAC
jgi:hypothetical protein